MARGGELFGGSAVLALAMGPAHAQIDFSEAWAPLFHEDLPERIPGPELGDYMGIPINDAGRLARTATTPIGFPSSANISVARTAAIIPCAAFRTCASTRFSTR